jgi:transcriptional regulator NrdR family protein
MATSCSLQRIAAHRENVADEDLRRLARDIEATLLDAGHKSVKWSEIVAQALARLENIDPVSAQRLAANYTDESGAVKLDNDAPARPTQQLGLPLDEE